MVDYGRAIDIALSGVTPAFISDSGQYIAGEIVDRYVVEGEYGEYPVLEVEADSGKFAIEADGDIITAEKGSVYAVHCFREILENQVKRLMPFEGDAIVIGLAGRKASKRKGHDDMYLYNTRIVQRAADTTQADDS